MSQVTFEDLKQSIEVDWEKGMQNKKIDLLLEQNELLRILIGRVTNIEDQITFISNNLMDKR